MSTDQIKNLLQVYLPFPAIISLLGATCLGVWVGANTLNEIRNAAKETRNELWTAKKEINEKLDAQASHSEKLDGKVETIQTTVTTLTVQTGEMRRQLDKMQN